MPLTPKRSLHSGFIYYKREEWKQLILTQVMTANLSPPPTHLPSKGEKYRQIRSTSWILGPVATKWWFQQDCFALVSKLLCCLRKQWSLVAMQKAKHKTLLISEILLFTWNTKALREEKRYKIQAENDSLSPTFIFSTYPPTPQKIAWLKFHLAQK